MDTQLLQKLVSRMVIMPSGCWEWQGALTSGYGYMAWKGHNLLTHRAMWIATHGDIPEDIFVCHDCPEGDNRACINPEHLFLGTPKDNMDDMTAKGRRSDGPEHSKAIKRGWTPEVRAKRAEDQRRKQEHIHKLQTESAGVPYEWKYCPGCRTWRPRMEFGSNSARYDKLDSYCLYCTRANYS